MESHRPRWTPWVKLTVVLLLLGLGCFLLYRFRLAVKPLIIAAVLAYILSPLVSWFQVRFKMRRAFASVLVYLLMLLILIAIPLTVIPILNAQNTDLKQDILDLLHRIEFLAGNNYVIAGYIIDVQAIIQQLRGSVQTILQPVFGKTFGFAIEIISSLVWLVFVLVVSFYLVKDADSLRNWLEDIIPATFKPDYIHLRSDINEIWGAFFRGQLLLALVVSSIFTVVGFIIGLPFALAMGVLAGLLEFLPSLGHGIWMVTAASLALFLGSKWLPIPNWAFMVLVVVLQIIYQQFDLNYLIPRIIGRQVHLPPLVIILGIATGALLAGVLGIFLAAPTIASLRVLGRYIYANLFDEDPFPTPAAPPLPPPNPRWWRKTPLKQPNDLPNKP